MTNIESQTELQLQPQQFITFFDTETTSNKEDAHLCQIACIQEYIHSTVQQPKQTLNKYYKPPAAITFGAMAVHHITNELISDYISLTHEDRTYITNNFFTDSYIIAHNINFDLNILNNDNIQLNNCKIIDTLKLAKDILEDAEAYNLQYLRYFLGLNKEYTAHDAMGDIDLLKDIFYILKDKKEKQDLLQEQPILTTTLQEFLEYAHQVTINPQLIKKFTFGKYNGRLIEDVAKYSPDYLEWLLRSERSKPESEQNKDMIFTLKKYVN